jgi:hypothetical protein
MHDMDTQPPAGADIENAIRNYLQAHPHAIDTERGIREWWLRDAWPPFRAADVHTAIERLVAGGELAARSLPDGQRAYSISSPPTQVPGLRPPDKP